MMSFPILGMLAVCGGEEVRFECGTCLISPVAREYSSRRNQENLEVQPQRPILGVVQIQADHIVEAGPAAAADLPQAGDARLHLQNPAPVPQVVSLKLVGDGRTRSDQRHFTLENVDELG